MNNGSTTKEVLRFVGNRGTGQDIIDIRNHLGSPPWLVLKALLDNLVAGRLLIAENRIVEGGRLATFYRVTPQGLDLTSAD